MAFKRGLFKTKTKKSEAEKEDSALDKYFNRATSEYEEVLEEPHHSENCDNISSQTDDVMPDSQRRSLCTRCEVSHLESVESDEEGRLSAGASDESYQHENSKFDETTGWSNDPATWPGVMNQNVNTLRAGVRYIRTGSNHYNPTRNCNCVTQCHKNASFFYIRCTYM